MTATVRLLSALATWADRLSDKRFNRGMDAINKYGRIDSPSVQNRVHRALKDLDTANALAHSANRCRETIKQIEASQ